MTVSRLAQPPLLSDEQLERSSIVANVRMNRDRVLAGTNGYSHDLGFYPLDRLVGGKPANWLDVCCGSGKALIEAGLRIRELGLQETVTVIGIDLVGMFATVPRGLDFVTLEEASVSRWEPSTRFSLITCVHGLHYVGDKLGTLVRCAGWLAPGGLLAANLDMRSVKVDGASAKDVVTALTRAGFQYQARRKLITCETPKVKPLPYAYLGADDTAGPNYTGQPAVDSWYRAR